MTSRDCTLIAHDPRAPAVRKIAGNLPLLDSGGRVYNAWSKNARGTTLRTVRDVSSGGVITRVEGSSLELVLVGRARPERWSIPKGTPIPGETLEETAIREVREETGLNVRILEPIGDITYWFSTRGVRHHKTVYFYLLEALGGNVEDHDWENDFVEWLSENEALRRMSFASEVNIVERAIRRTRARLEMETSPPVRAP
jgi:8-oxo-dGTP pyrophosphatase MutT (NUDIX family)